VANLRVKLERVQKTFPRSGRAALAEISAELRPGIITGLVGPDGAGKTTLLRLMAGLLLPSGGRILFESDGPEAGSPRTGGEKEAGPAQFERVREWIGYMPQKFGLYEDLTVQENLELHADLRGVLGREREEAFRRLLAFTDLGRFTERLAGKLSGGMKQKLGLACALLGRPRLLLLDEPSVGVDPISRRELWKMVHELIQQGLTVVWSTAYLDEAELCREVLLLNEGKLLFLGNPAELTGRMRDRCWQIRNASGNRRELLARALHAPEVMDGVIQGHAVRLVLRQRQSHFSTTDLHAGPQAELVPVPPRFEDGFIDILGGGPGGDSGLAPTCISN
jgi:ABC-2 type transport system ATP-binding protein